MPRTPQDITDAELSVLQVLWDQGTATVRELTERLYKECTLSLTATVQKLLERLEGKKCVKRDRKTWPHSFSATVKREELIARQLQTTANKLCSGKLHPLLTCLVKTHGLSPEDRESLRGLLDELDRKRE
uniref:BlaI/MecI/CopY family transcriptional regulator n=1 Tax=Schlesneria paludicola TaxID=360056 RepID=A0A7C2NX79_9PLAN